MTSRRTYDGILKWMGEKGKCGELEALLYEMKLFPFDERRKHFRDFYGVVPCQD